MNPKYSNLVSSLAIFATVFATNVAVADPLYGQKAADHRKQTKDQWRDIGTASAAAALLGIITKNGTVTTVGAVGALYSAYRYEQDRKSESKLRRQKADMFSHDHYVHNGVRYDRKTVYKKGVKYYRFEKHR